MSKESIFYNEKSADVYVEHQDDVWDGAYAEVAYEENVEDNSQLNLSYNPVEQCSVMSEMYETAGEDNTQYFSIIDNTVNSNLLSDDDTINNSHIESHNTTLITQFGTEEIVEEKVEQSEPAPPDENETESEDQVILYRKEGSDELYAVQIARDGDGNVQKYQYQVRQSEDGQLEAVPGTIRLQPEGTEQLICDDLETPNEPNPTPNNIVEDEKIKIDSPEVVYQPKPSPPALQPISSPTKPKTDDESFPHNILDDDEFSNMEYLQEDLEEVAATVSLLSRKTSPAHNIIPPTKPSQDQNKRPKIKANIVSIRHEKNEKPEPRYDQSKSLLKRQSNFIFDNDNIKYKHIPSPVPNRGNKLTYLIMTQPMKKLVQQPISRPMQNFSTARKFRSILRPSVGTAAKSNSPVIRSFCKAITEEPQNKFLKKFPPSAEIVRIDHATPVAVENRVPRQPRKQIITPVDREGSEIIIHTPHEDDVMETYDLDSLSDGDERTRVKTPRRRTPKKKGRKPRAISTPSNNIKVENVDLVSNSQSESAISPVPESTTKRGPGRRKLVEVENKKTEEKNGEDKRRGRKSRDLNETVKRKNSDLSEIDTVPRKRGRPRRKPLETTESETSVVKNEIENMFGFTSTSDDDGESKKDISTDGGEKNKEDVLLLALKDAEIIEDFESSEPVSTKDAPPTMTTTPTPTLPDSADAIKVQVENKKTLRSRRTISHSVSDTDQKEGGIYKCSKCSESFSQYLTYKNHLKTHLTLKAVGGNSCSVCKRSFTSQKLLNQHKLSHVDSITFRRGDQSKEDDLRRLRPSTQTKTELSSGLGRGNMDVDKVDDDKDRLGDGDEKTHACHVCSKEFRQLAHLVMHREIHNKHPCINCGKSFSTKNLLEEHKSNCCADLKKYRTSQPSVVLTKKVFTCQTCNKHFTNNMFYKNHLKSHQGQSATVSSAAPGDRVVKNGGGEKISVSRHSIRKQVPSAKANAFECGKCKQSFITYTGLAKHKCNDVKHLRK